MVLLHLDIRKTRGPCCLYSIDTRGHYALSVLHETLSSQIPVFLLSVTHLLWNILALFTVLWFIKTVMFYSFVFHRCMFPFDSILGCLWDLSLWELQFFMSHWVFWGPLSSWTFMSDPGNEGSLVMSNFFPTPWSTCSLYKVYLYVLHQTAYSIFELK